MATYRENSCDRKQKGEYAHAEHSDDEQDSTASSVDDEQADQSHDKLNSVENDGGVNRPLTIQTDALEDACRIEHDRIDS